MIHIQTFVDNLSTV